MNDLVLCPKCKGETIIDGATGSIFCSECSYTFNQDDVQQVLKDAYIIQKEKEREEK